MPNPLTSMPHVYFNKKYIGLRHQNVTVHPPPFAYSRTKGIESCVQQLNNINAVIGSSLVMLTSMCHLFGIPSAMLVSRQRRLNIYMIKTVYVLS